MSEEINEPTHPVLSYLGTVFLFLVPGALIIMLGYLGMAFMGHMGVETPEKEEGATVAARSTPAPAETAPADGGDGGGSGDSSPAGESAASKPQPETAAAEGGGSSAGGIDPAVMQLGKSAYATCQACHGPDGTGLQTGPMKMAPSLVGSELLLGDPDKSLLTVLKGIKKEGMDYMGMMAPLGGTLDDEKMAAVLTYVRNSWGNSAPPVTPEQAARAREKFADVEAPGGVPRDQIDEIVAKHSGE